MLGSGVAIHTDNSELRAHLQRVVIATNEGSGLTTNLAGVTVMPIGLGEKGICPTKMEASLGDKHAATFSIGSESAIATISKAFDAIYSTIPTPHYTNLNAMLIHDLKEIPDHNIKTIARKIENGNTFSREILKLIDDDLDIARFMMPQFTNMINAIKFQSYVAFNVAPGYAVGETVTMMMPGLSAPCESAAAELNSIVDDDKVAVTRKNLQGLDMDATTVIGKGTMVNITNQYVTRIFNSIKAVASQAMPDVHVVHSYLPGGVTDCIMLQYAGIQCINFAPLRMPDGVSLATVAHSSFEYVMIDAFKEGISLYTKSISNFAA
jgi:acetylornithine deacetylase/succinyl-diaminopimelate desuccinylase-like protein